MNVSGGMIDVDSSNSQAVNVQNGATISVGVLDVTGNVRVDSNSMITGTVTTGTPPISDPLAGLPAVTTTGLTTQSANMLNIPDNITITLNPGVFMNGIKTGKNDNITLNPGIYYLKGGGFNIGNNTVVTGNGVLIYNAWQGNGDEIQLTGMASLTLSVPMTGTYAGRCDFRNAFRKYGPHDGRAWRLALERYRNGIPAECSSTSTTTERLQTSQNPHRMPPPR